MRITSIRRIFPQNDHIRSWPRHWLSDSLPLLGPWLACWGLLQCGSTIARHLTPRRQTPNLWWWKRPALSRIPNATVLTCSENKVLNWIIVMIYEIRRFFVVINSDQGLIDLRLFESLSAIISILCIKTRNVIQTHLGNVGLCHCQFVAGIRFLQIVDLFWVMIP